MNKIPPPAPKKTNKREFHEDDEELDEGNENPIRLIKKQPSLYYEDECLEPEPRNIKRRIEFGDEMIKENDLEMNLLEKSLSTQVFISALTYGDCKWAAGLILSLNGLIYASQHVDLLNRSTSNLRASFNRGELVGDVLKTPFQTVWCALKMEKIHLAIQTHFFRENETTANPNHTIGFDWDLDLVTGRVTIYKWSPALCQFIVVLLGCPINCDFFIGTSPNVIRRFCHCLDIAGFRQYFDYPHIPCRQVIVNADVLNGQIFYDARGRFVSFFAIMNDNPDCPSSLIHFNGATIFELIELGRGFYGYNRTKDPALCFPKQILDFAANLPERVVGYNESYKQYIEGSDEPGPLISLYFSAKMQKLLVDDHPSAGKRPLSINLDHRGLPSSLTLKKI